MVATKKSVGDAKRYTITALASNGGVCEHGRLPFRKPCSLKITAILCWLRIQLLCPRIIMTLAIGVEVQKVRVIKEGRAEDAAQRLDEALRKEGGPEARATPVAKKAHRRGEEKSLKRKEGRSQGSCC